MLSGNAAQAISWLFLLLYVIVHIFHQNNFKLNNLTNSIVFIQYLGLRIIYIKLHLFYFITDKINQVFSTKGTEHYYVWTMFYVELLVLVYTMYYEP